MWLATSPNPCCLRPGRTAHQPHPPAPGACGGLEGGQQQQQKKNKKPNPPFWQSSCCLAPGSGTPHTSQLREDAFQYPNLTAPYWAYCQVSLCGTARQASGEHCGVLGRQVAPGFTQAAATPAALQAHWKLL